MWTDPLVIRSLLIILVVFAATAVVCWGLAILNERALSHVPSYRRELEATYARFHRFLAAVRAAARLSLRE
jgi:hypothetical protein